MSFWNDLLSRLDPSKGTHQRSTPAAASLSCRRAAGGRLRFPVDAVTPAPGPCSEIDLEDLLARAFGGGVYLLASSPILSQTSIVGNSAKSKGEPRYTVQRDPSATAVGVSRGRCSADELCTAWEHEQSIFVYHIGALVLW